jgi:drug/metabolite transporter (DMT)-like permease
MTSETPTEPPTRPNATAYLMIAVITVLWGVNFSSLKIAVSEFPPWSFRVLCVVCGATGLLSIAHFAFGHSLLVHRGELGKLTIAALLNITGFQLCVAFGLLLVEAGRGAVVAHTMPFWAMIFAAIFLGERLTLARCLGLALGLGGLFILIGKDLIGLGGSPYGVGLILCAAISWGAGTVVIKSQKWATPVIILTGWQFILGGVPILIGMLIFEMNVEYQPLSINAWIAVIYSAFIPMIVCHLLWYTLIGMLPTTIAAISTLAIPIVGVYCSAILLGEQVGTREWISLVLVVFALGIVLAPTAFWRRFRL